MVGINQDSQIGSIIAGAKTLGVRLQHIAPQSFYNPDNRLGEALNAAGIGRDMNGNKILLFQDANTRDAFLDSLTPAQIEALKNAGLGFATHPDPAVGVNGFHPSYSQFYETELNRIIKPHLCPAPYTI